MTTQASLYYISTGCIHPEEKYNQLLHVNGGLSQSRSVMNYLNKDIAWRVSLNCAERHLPSRKYVKTGKLYPDETFDARIHKITNRNIRSVSMDRINYFYQDLVAQDQNQPPPPPSRL
jgi:hypothetical protein